MKHNFMNKENGKVASVLVMYLDDEGHMQTDSYDKVEDLMEDYAAYKPAKPEPLIKDEKVRKARARHRGSRVCWYVSICWQVLGIFGMIMHIDDANTCEIIGVLWLIVALLVRREE